MPKVLLVLIHQIKIGASRRPVKDEKIVELMQSIRVNGLLNPITIDQNHNLIAGLHRLTACKMLSYKHIECRVISYEDADQARLAEIDENFIRNELEPLERYELWLERDKILERMGLRFKQGDNQYTKKGGEMVSLPSKTTLPRTTLELARGFGYSERSFQQGKQIARDIHPDVKQKIITTPFKKSRTVQLKIARIAATQRIQAEMAEKAFEEAMVRGDNVEAERQAQLSRQARDKQKGLQLQALEDAMSDKLTTGRTAKQAKYTAPAKNDKLIVQPIETGEKWMLHKHLVYRGKTSGKQFINLLPSDAALAIATLSPFWEHDYLINEARVVAVLRSQGHINNFCRNNKMPFQYELVFNQLYISVFSLHTIPKPESTICIEGIETAISYLLSMYTHPNSFVISPFMGQGETLIACEKLGRICFVGDESSDLIHRGITRWQKLTNKQARKTSL
jgi:ParB family transcriptional regulator, chromosome partitioning protein